MECIIYDTRSEVMSKIEVIKQEKFVYCQYPMQYLPQPAYLYLEGYKEGLREGYKEGYKSIPQGKIRCDYSGEIGNSVPANIWHNTVLRWRIPEDRNLLFYDLLMAEVKPLAEQLLEFYNEDYSSGNLVGTWRGSEDIIYEIESKISEFSSYYCYAITIYSNPSDIVASEGDWLFLVPEFDNWQSIIKNIEKFATAVIESISLDADIIEFDRYDIERYLEKYVLPDIA